MAIELSQKNTKQTDQTMSFQDSVLPKLLNDDTFVAWVKSHESLNRSEKNKWDDWLKKDSNHKKIVYQAKKFLDMPFKEIQIDCYNSGELDRLFELLKHETNE